MKKFKFDKLIRDKLLNMMEDGGIIVHTKQLASQAQVVDYYKAKIVEEATELLQANSRETLIEEIVDLAEVLDALLIKAGITQQEVECIRETKRLEKGGFSDAVVVESVELSLDNKAIDYYLANQDKYPEIE